MDNWQTFSKSQSSTYCPQPMKQCAAVSKRVLVSSETCLLSSVFLLFLLTVSWCLLKRVFCLLYTHLLRQKRRVFCVFVSSETCLLSSVFLSLYTPLVSCVFLSLYTPLVSSVRSLLKRVLCLFECIHSCFFECI